MFISAEINYLRNTYTCKINNVAEIEGRSHCIIELLSTKYYPFIAYCIVHPIVVACSIPSLSLADPICRFGPAKGEGNHSATEELCSCGDFCNYLVIIGAHPLNVRHFQSPSFELVKYSTCTMYICILKQDSFINGNKINSHFN